MLSEMARRYLFEYKESQEIGLKDYGFYSLLFELIRRADTDNFEKLKLMWPLEVAAMQELYNTPIDWDAIKRGGGI